MDARAWDIPLPCIHQACDMLHSDSEGLVICMRGTTQVAFDVSTCRRNLRKQTRLGTANDGPVRIACVTSTPFETAWMQLLALA